MSEQHCVPHSGMEETQQCSGRSFSGDKPMGSGAAMAKRSHLQRRINECLYNAAVADTLDRERPEDAAHASAMCKLREVLGRAACAAGSGLPLELEAQTLLLLGKLQAARGHAEDAVDTCAALILPCWPAVAMGREPGATLMPSVKYTRMQLHCPLASECSCYNDHVSSPWSARHSATQWRPCA